MGFGSTLAYEIFLTKGMSEMAGEGRLWPPTLPLKQAMGTTCERWAPYNLEERRIFISEDRGRPVGSQMNRLY